MTKQKDHIEMTLEAAKAFAKGGKLDAQELTQIVAIAERDGVLDQDEIRVLRSIILRIKPSEVDVAMKRKLAELLEKISQNLQAG